MLRNNNIMMKYVWEELIYIESTRDYNNSYDDDWCVVTLIQGVCFRALQQRLDEAQQCFDAILKRGDLVKQIAMSRLLLVWKWDFCTLILGC